MYARSLVVATLALIATAHDQIEFHDTVFISEGASNSPRSVITADINRDTFADLVYCSSAGVHYALFDSASESFGAPQLVVTSAAGDGEPLHACAAIVATYWDDDDIVDLVYGVDGNALNSAIWWARGTGGLSTMFLFGNPTLITASLDEPPGKIVAGNFTGHGTKMDLAMIVGEGRGDDIVSYWMVGGTSDMHRIENGRASDLVVMDVNYDGLDDILTVWGDAEAHIFLNTGSGSRFTTDSREVIGLADSTGSVTMGDVNGDGILDGVIADDKTSNVNGGEVRYAPRNSSTSFDFGLATHVFNVPWSNVNEPPIRMVRTARVHADDFAESIFLLTTNAIYVAENLYDNTEGVSWQLSEKTFAELGSGAADEDLFLNMVVEDLNLDGYVDIVLASPANDWVVYVQQVAPTPAPSPMPTAMPTSTPTAVPTADPTAMPTADPTSTPTAMPTADPTAAPTADPTATPTAEPTATPTAVPTSMPTAVPTGTPTAEPTDTPTATPTLMPTAVPTAMPTAVPTAMPTAAPTLAPTPEATPPPEPEPDVPELILLGRTPQQISNDGGNFSIAIQHLDPNFQVRIHWGDAGDLFTTEEVVLQYGTQSAVNTSLLQTNSEMDFVDTANHMSGNSIELLQIVGSDQGITSFGGEQCDALCGDVPQGVDSTECQCFAFAIPANPQNLTSPDFLDGLPVYISVLNLENFQRVLSPPNFLKYETLFCAGEFWQPDPNSPHCEPCPSCGFCPGGHRVWPLEGCWSPDETVPPIECRIAEACEGVDPNEPECSRQADESCESTDDNPCVCLEVATEICSSGYEDRLCSSCAEHHYSDGTGQCLQCSDTPTSEQRSRDLALLIVVAFVYLLFISLALVFLGDRKLGTFVAVLVGLQQFSLIASNAAAYMEGLPESTRVSLSRLALLNFQVEFFRPECLDASFDWIDFFWATLAFMAVAVVMFITAAYLRKHYLRFEVKHRIEERVVTVLDRWYALIVIHGIVQCCGRRRAPKSRQNNYLQRQPTVPNVDVNPKSKRGLQRMNTVRDTDMMSVEKTEEKPESSKLAYLFFTPSRIHEKIFKYRAIHSVCILGSILYLQITQRALTGIHCVASEPSDIQVLQVAQSIECFESKHLVASVFIVGLLVFYSVAFPMWTLRILLRLRKKGSDSYHSSEKYGFLYRGLKKRYLLFRWILFPLSFALALQNTFADHPSTQLFIGCIIFISYVLVVATVWPFRNWYNNVSYLAVGVGALIQLMIFLNTGRDGVSCLGTETEESDDAAGFLTSVSVCRDTASFALLVLVAVLVAVGFFLIVAVNVRRRVKTGRWLPPQGDGPETSSATYRRHNRNLTVMSLQSDSEMAAKPFTTPSASPNITQRSPVPMISTDIPTSTESSSSSSSSPSLRKSPQPTSPGRPETAAASVDTSPPPSIAMTNLASTQREGASAETSQDTLEGGLEAGEGTPSTTKKRSAWGAGSVRVRESDFVPTVRVGTTEL